MYFCGLITSGYANLTATSHHAGRIFDRLRVIIKEELKKELQQDQLLTREGALKVAGISNVTFLKAINDGIVKPQLVKDRKRAMNLEVGSPEDRAKEAKKLKTGSRS